MFDFVPIVFKANFSWEPRSHQRNLSAFREAYHTNVGSDFKVYTLPRGGGGNEAAH